MTAPSGAHELDINEFFQTNDAAMATYLKLSGHPTQRVEFRGRTCWWIFRVTDALLNESEKFLGGLATVEPREYSRHFNETIEELRNLRREAFPSDGRGTRR